MSLSQSQHVNTYTEFNAIHSLQDYLVEKWYEHIMETLKGTQWIFILQCAGCFAVTDGDIVLKSTYSNFNKRGPCTLLQSQSYNVNRPLRTCFSKYFANITEGKIRCLKTTIRENGHIFHQNHVKYKLVPIRKIWKMCHRANAYFLIIS